MKNFDANLSKSDGYEPSNKIGSPISFITPKNLSDPNVQTSAVNPEISNGPIPQININKIGGHTFDQN